MFRNAPSPETVEYFLKTVRLKNFPEVYSLAPRGHRIGFYFQQLRAVFLARILADRLGREALQTCRIAIVGGGVSGVTVAAALRELGAQDLSLFEAKSECLTVASKATHRIVHPDI